MQLISWFSPLPCPWKKLVGRWTNSSALCIYPLDKWFS